MKPVQEKWKLISLEEEESCVHSNSYSHKCASVRSATDSITIRVLHPSPTLKNIKNLSFSFSFFRFLEASI